ncbi:MAG: helix-turn-helix domain-containing protein [Pseudolabrys sp.]
MPKKSVPRADNMHGADVVAAVHRAGTTLAELAERHDRTGQALSMALRAPRKPSNEIIAAFLGKKLHEIWPRWFDENGLVISKTPEPARRWHWRSNQKRKAA